MKTRKGSWLTCGKRGASLEEKIGAKLAQRNTHIANMVVADVNGDGVMDKSEFLGCQGEDPHLLLRMTTRCTRCTEAR